MRPVPSDLFDSARHYLYELDVAGNRADVLDVERAFYSAPFLDERALPETPIGGWRYPLDDLLAAHAARRTQPTAGSVDKPLRWIFHIGHCGSTLLSRLLDRLPSVLGVREPVPLLALAAALRERDGLLAAVAPQRVDATLALAADLLGRGFNARDRVVVKATSTTCSLAPSLLATRRNDRAILLSLALPRYLAAYLRDPALRAQARANTAPRLADWHAWTGDTTLRLWRLDDTQCIALTWLVETERFSRCERDPQTSARVLRIDGDELVARPKDCLARIAEHLQLDATAQELEYAIAGDVLNRYAKETGRVYDAGARATELARAAERFAPEIEAAITWADQQSELLRRDSPALPEP